MVDLCERGSEKREFLLGKFSTGLAKRGARQREGRGLPSLGSRPKGRKRQQLWSTVRKARKERRRRLAEGWSLLFPRHR